MYLVNKIIGGLISPIGIMIMMLIVAGGLLVLKRAKVWRRVLMVAAGVWLWLWATPLMTCIVGATLEEDFLVEGRVPSAEEFHSADAILLLGGGMGVDTNLSGYAEMWWGADRVWQAARLFKAGKAPKIIATGGQVEASTGGLLADFGVPREAIVFDDQPRNTEEEAKAAARREDKTVLLVTSAWHMKRAKLMFDKYAPEIKAIPAPADFEATMRARGLSVLDALIPKSEALAQNEVFFHEWLGYWGYRLFR